MDKWWIINLVAEKCDIGGEGVGIMFSRRKDTQE